MKSIVFGFSLLLVALPALGQLSDAQQSRARTVFEYNKAEINRLLRELQNSKEDSSVDPVLFKMALLSLPNEEW